MRCPECNRPYFMVNQDVKICHAEGCLITYQEDQRNRHQFKSGGYHDEGNHQIEDIRDQARIWA